MEKLISVLLYLILAPLVGGLLAGIDRKISARMQSRVGPPLLQPFYDVLKLLKKDNLVVNRFQNFYLFCFLLFIIFTGALFFAGGDFLLVIFALTLASIFLVFAGYSTYSPYSHVGTERELIQMMAYEPMVILTAVAMYMICQSFNISSIMSYSKPLIIFLPGVFIGFIFILTIKLRKSPFDLSMSHHAHQEIVRGIITEFSGPALAMIEIAHWYENVFLLAIVYMFFSFNPVLGVVATLLVFVLEMFIDNTNARVKWQLTMKSSWLVALIFGVTNIIVIYILNYFKLIVL